MKLPLLSRLSYALFPVLLVSITAHAQDADATASPTPAAVPPVEASQAATPEGTEASGAAASPTPVDPFQEQLAPLMTRFGKFFEERNFTEAAKILDEAEKIAPDHDVVRGARAGVYAESGEIDKARVIYQSMVEKNPEAFIPRYNLCEVLLLEKKYAEGRAAFEKLLEAFPNSDLIRYKILLTYLAEKDPAKAMEVLQQMEQVTPSPFTMYGAAAIAFYNADLLNGRRMILAAEQAFGPGSQRLLYDSLAEIGLVLRSDYPPVMQQGGSSSPEKAPEPGGLGMP